MTNKFTILGSGSSLGVPRIDGDFGKCNPNDQKIIDRDVVLIWSLMILVF